MLIAIPIAIPIAILRLHSQADPGVVPVLPGSCGLRVLLLGTCGFPWVGHSLWGTIRCNSPVSPCLCWLDAGWPSISDYRMSGQGKKGQVRIVPTSYYW